MRSFVDSLFFRVFPTSHYRLVYVWSLLRVFVKGSVFLLLNIFYICFPNLLCTIRKFWSEIKTNKNMKVLVNSKEVETQATVLSDLATELQFPEKGVAVGVNNVVVPRAKWAEKALSDGDKIVMIKATCGG